MADSHSNLAQTIYIDLLQSHLDEPVSSLRGSLSFKDRNGKVYWYDNFKIGAKTFRIPLGEENPDLQNRMLRHEKIKEQLNEIRKRRKIMIRHLQVESYQSFDTTTGRLLSAFSKDGFFRMGGLLVGTTAFRCYECALGTRFISSNHSHAQFDEFKNKNHVKLAMGKLKMNKLERTMKAFDFEHISSSDENAKICWKQSNDKTIVEFKFPSPKGLDHFSELSAKSHKCTQSRLLKYLTYKPIQVVALHRDGVLVNVPQPERFAIYNLIKAGRRSKNSDQNRLRRELMQSLWLTETLSENRPSDLCKAFKAAVNTDSNYIEYIRNSTETEPKIGENLARLKLKV